MRNPVLRKEMHATVRSRKLMIGLLFYNVLLALWAISCFRINFYDEDGLVENAYQNITIVFSMIEIAQFILLAFIVPAVTAGAISGEREKQTLEILLTTPLGTRRMIMGKLLSSIGTVLLYIVSSMPILSIVFLVGGISLYDLTYMLLYCFVFAIFAGSIGIFFSALYKRSILATVTTYGVGILLCFFPYIAYFFRAINLSIYEELPSPDWLVAVGLLSPLFSGISLLSVQIGSSLQFENLCYDMINAKYHWYQVGEHAWFWISIAVQLVVAGLLLWAAVRYLDPIRKKRWK